MSWGIPHIEVLITWSVCFILWALASYLLSKSVSGIVLGRRILFLTLGLLGTGLLITMPHRKVETESAIVHIQTSSISDSLQRFSTPNQVVFSGVHSFLQSEFSKRTTNVHIHGIGLSKEELSLLESYNLSFHPPDLIAGITRVNLPNITEQQHWTLNGVFQGEDVISIYLVAPDQVAHHATISDSSFQINSVAPVAGSYLMPLCMVTSDADTITELLPLEILHEPRWKMLVLSSYPSFEINYLKQYWTSLGNGFALRSQVAEDKFNNSFVNIPEKNLNVITGNILSEFDFVIIDVSTWNQLSNQEQFNIQRSVLDEGLALLFRPTGASGTTNNLQLPTLGEPQGIEWKTNNDEVILTHYAIQVSGKTSQLQGHTLATYRSSGLGHIGRIAVDDTYKLILADNERSYQNLWSTIFSDLYRDFSPSYRLLHNDWIWAGEKTQMTILGKEEVSGLPIHNDTLPLPVMHVPFLDRVDEVTLWPTHGYNSISVRPESVDTEHHLFFYAHDRSSWRAMRQHELKSINRRSGTISETPKSSDHEVDKKYPLWWWYVLCLFGFGLLWLDERLFEDV